MLEEVVVSELEVGNIILFMDDEVEITELVEISISETIIKGRYLMDDSPFVTRRDNDELIWTVSTNFPE